MFRPITFGILYLATWAIFAFVYLLKIEEFQVSGESMDRRRAAEQSAAWSKIRDLKLFEHDLVGEIRQEWQAFCEDNKKLNFEIDDCASRLTFSLGNNSIELRFEFFGNMKTKYGTQQEFRIQKDLTVNPSDPEYKQESSIEALSNQIEEYNGTKNQGKSRLHSNLVGLPLSFKQHLKQAGKIENTSLGYQVWWPDEIKKQINEQFRIILGLSAKSRSNIIRSMYFSASVITTLGVSEIRPFSDATRLLVGLEALLGIIIAGCFISSVFYRSAANS